MLAIGVLDSLGNPLREPSRAEPLQAYRHIALNEKKLIHFLYFHKHVVYFHKHRRHLFETVRTKSDKKWRNGVPGQVYRQLNAKNVISLAETEVVRSFSADTP